MNDQNLTSLPWEDYELLDSGENIKLERFGAITLVRPETQALWKKQHSELWASAHAEFQFHNKKGGWEMQKSVPESWELVFENIRFSARLTSFKHVGVFPEQAPNWRWLRDVVRPDMKVLNLFGYTGIASLVAAKAGAQVTHVDASKQSLDWAHENARLSGLGEDKVRWILDDALAFVKRELRREVKYDGIVLDPPVFGRGTKGEVWRIEEDFPKLLEALKELLSDKPGAFSLVNGYAAGYSPPSFAQTVEDVFNVPVQAGELHIKESTSERVIPSGIYVRFVRPEGAPRG